MVGGMDVGVTPCQTLVQLTMTMEEVVWGCDRPAEVKRVRRGAGREWKRNAIGPSVESCKPPPPLPHAHSLMHVHLGANGEEIKKNTDGFDRPCSTWIEMCRH